MFEKSKFRASALYSLIRQYITKMLGEEGGSAKPPARQPSFDNQTSAPFPSRLLYHVCMTLGVISIALVLGFIVEALVTQLIQF